MKAKLLAACGGLLLITLFAATPAKKSQVGVEIGGVTQPRRLVEKVITTGHRCFKALSSSLTEVHHDPVACMKPSRPTN